MTSTLMLEANNLVKTFDATIALDGVHIEIHRGEVVALLGPNGAGKTTLMRLLTGFYNPNGGSILWHGQSVESTKSSSWKERKIGYLPENNPLYPTMTVWEYLQFMSKIKQVLPRETKTELAFVIDRCNLEQVLSKKIETLSRGYKQRVGLAAALLGKPDLLILDEPTSGLDPNQAIEIRDLIVEIAKKHAVLLSTHILSEVKTIASRMYILSQGKIVFEGKVSSVKNLEKKFIQLTT